MTPVYLESREVRSREEPGTVQRGDRDRGPKPTTITPPTEKFVDRMDPSQNSRGPVTLRRLVPTPGLPLPPGSGLT